MNQMLCVIFWEVFLEWKNTGLGAGVTEQDQLRVLRAVHTSSVFFPSCLQCASLFPHLWWENIQSVWIRELQIIQFLENEG